MGNDPGEVEARLDSPVSALPAPKVPTRMRRPRWTAFALVAATCVLSFLHLAAPPAIAGELRRSFGDLTRGGAGDGAADHRPLPRAGLRTGDGHTSLG